MHCTASPAVWVRVMDTDQVIAGGGSAGCVLAARLTEDPSVTVCLIEAGGERRGFQIQVPAMVAAMVSGRPPIDNRAFHTVPQPGLNGRRGFQPRGRTLGGSSAINAMLYLRGHAADDEEWEELGAEGWDGAQVLPWFVKAEGNVRGGVGFARRGRPPAGGRPAPPPVRFPAPSCRRRRRCRSRRTPISTAPGRTVRICIG